MDELFRTLGGSYAITAIAALFAAGLTAWFIIRRNVGDTSDRFSSVEHRRGASSTDELPVDDKAADNVHVAPCRIVEPMLGSLGPGEEDKTATRFTLETHAGRTNYQVELSLRHDANAQRTAQREGARLRAVAATYEMRIRRDRGAALLVGTVRLGVDGHGKLSRVTVQKLKPTFPQVQAAARDWLLGFVGQEFIYRELLTTKPYSSRRAI